MISDGLSLSLSLSLYLLVHYSFTSTLVPQESRLVSNEDKIRELIGNAKESAEILDALVVQSQIDENGNLSAFDVHTHS